MKLQIGQRLPSNPLTEVANDAAARIKQRNAAVYIVSEVLAETPWNGLYRGKKVFRNAKSDSSDLDEANADECLDVLFKTINYSRLDSRDYVKTRRADMWLEAKTILGCRQTNLLPEPLDFLEEHNAHDAFQFARSAQLIDREPVLVLENIVGQPLARWCNNRRPDVKRALHVASEILHYVDVMHDEGFVVNAVHPGAFWIDETDRVYHLATDCVAASSNPVRLSSDRFPYGFAAAEAYNPAESIDHRSDLYGWAALAYFLVTGESPAQIAAAQGTRFATFQRCHRERFAAALGILSKHDTPHLSTWLKVGGRRFVRSFPESLVHAVFSCLEQAREDRPASVGVFRSWCEKSPPPAIPAAVAITSSRRHTNLIVATSGLSRGLSLVVRRGHGRILRTATDGVSVYDGPMCNLIRDGAAVNGSDTSGDTHYSLFCRDSEDDTVSYSSAVVATAVDITEIKQLLDFCEDIASREPPPNSLLEHSDVPEVVRLVACHEEESSIARALLKSPVPLVQRWAVSVLEQSASRSSGKAMAVLREDGLRNAVFEIRMASARALLRGDPSLELILDVASSLGGQALDDRIRAVRSLGTIGLSAKAIQRAINSIESDRPITCSECQQSLKARELDEHLRGLHNYVELDSRLLPLGKVLRELWKRLLRHFDHKAADQLAHVLVDRYKNRPIRHLQSALLSQLSESWVPFVNRLPASAREHNLVTLAECLRSSRRMAEASFALLSAQDHTIRQLGKVTQLPLIAQSLVSDSGSVHFFKQQVEAICKESGLDEKLAACQSLVQRGASAIVAQQCAEVLELEREVPCPWCESVVPRRLLSKHERLVHDLYIFDQERVGWEDLAQRLGQRLVLGEPTLNEARLCMDVLAERVGTAEAPGRLARTLTSALVSLTDDDSCFDQMQVTASVIAQLDESTSIVGELIGLSEPSAVALGLIVFSSVQTISDSRVLDLVVASLARSDVALKVRTLALTLLLQEHRTNQTLVERALRSFVRAEPDKLAAIERLQSIVPAVGRLPAIESLCLELEGAMRIKCPVCQQVMTGAEMREHARSDHKKVWQGRRLRNPWIVAEEALEQYSTDARQQHLEQAEQCAWLAGGEQALRTLMRNSLQRGVAVDRYLPVLLRDAQSGEASICRQCYLLLKSPRVVMTAPVTLTESGNLRSDFVTIKRSQSGLLLETSIRVNDGQSADTQSEHHVSRNRLLALIGLLTGIALLGPLVLLVMGFQEAVIGLLCIGVMGALCCAGAALFCEAADYSALSIAWERVVLARLETNRSQEFLAFLIGLARLSEQHPSRGRERYVEKAAHKCLALFQEMKLNHSYAAVLHRLLLIDLLRNDKTGIRAMNLICDLVRHWRDGHIPSELLDEVTVDGALVGKLTSAQQRLLRWRFLFDCCVIGMPPAEALAMIEEAKVIHHLLTKPEHLIPMSVAVAFAMHRTPAQVLNSVDAISIFNLAERADLSSFESKHDVIVSSRNGELAIRSSGLFFRDMHLESVPYINIQEKREFVQTGWTHQRVDGGPDGRYRTNPPIGYDRKAGYILQVDRRNFDYSHDPSPIAEAIGNWSDLWFTHLAPAAATLVRQAPTGRRKHFGSASTIRCDGCGTVQAFLIGQLAAPVNGLCGQRGDTCTLREMPHVGN